MAFSPLRFVMETKLSLRRSQHADILCLPLDLTDNRITLFADGSPSTSFPASWSKLNFCHVNSSMSTAPVGKQCRNTGCPTTNQTRYFFNNSKTNEDIAMRFEQEYVRCVRNEEERVCSVCLFRYNIFIGFRIIKEMPGLVGSGTPYISYHIYHIIYKKFYDLLT